MIIATWNVNSISVRLAQVLGWIEANRPSVLCLQEIKTVEEKFPHKAFAELGYHCQVFGEKTYNGVALISDHPLEDVQRGLSKEVGPGSARLISGLYKGITIVDVYIPNGSEPGSEKYAYKLEWMSALHRHFQERFHCDQDLALLGDFNIAPLDIDVYDAKAASGQILVSDAERESLKPLNDWGLYDLYRKIHPTDENAFSWWDYRMNAFRRNMGYRIDHIWTTQSLSQKCTAIRIDKDPRKAERPSDHAPVLAEFKL